MTFDAADTPREVPAVPPVPGKTDPVPPEMPLPPGTGRVDHVNDRFWKDRDLVCEVFRREYGFDDDAELPDDLLAKFRSLWRVDLMGNDVEYSLEALVVRPLTFHYRWRPRPTVPSHARAHMFM